MVSKARELFKRGPISHTCVYHCKRIARERARRAKLLTLASRGRGLRTLAHTCFATKRVLRARFAHESTKFSELAGSPFHFQVRKERFLSDFSGMARNCGLWFLPMITKRKVPFRPSGKDTKSLSLIFAINHS